jgi:hypothetical protein
LASSARLRGVAARRRPRRRSFFCQVDVGVRGHVMLTRQRSDARCVAGQNWGWNRAGIWVDHGCGADFTVVRRW